jgi:hypothetical protein
VEAKSELFEVVAALHPTGGLARRLHRRQQQRNENADDRNDHQQLDQSEGRSPGPRKCTVHAFFSSLSWSVFVAERISIRRNGMNSVP